MHNTNTQVVDVCIPAHNEEKNILLVLNSIINQSHKSFTLRKIVVMCDGCTDKTAEAVRSIYGGDPLVQLLEDDQRVGKIQRLNNFFINCDADAVVVVDADVTLENFALEHIISQLDSSVGIVGGLVRPQIPRNFFEKIFFVWDDAWFLVRKDLNRGESVHNMYGSFFALSKAFYKHLHIPPESIAEDEFIYFEARRQHMQFVFAPMAVALFRLPATFREYVVQSSRHISTKSTVANYFSSDVLKEYLVPVRTKLKAIGVTFLRHPFLLLAALFIQMYVRILLRFKTLTYQNNTWEMAKTTK